MQNDPPANASPEQNPYESPEKISPLKPIPKPTVLAMVGIAAAVLVSSAIAFCCTCFPVALFTFELRRGGQPAPQEGFDWYVLKQSASWIAGVIAATLVGIWVRRSLWNRLKQ